MLKYVKRLPTSPSPYLFDFRMEKVGSCLNISKNPTEKEQDAQPSTQFAFVRI